MAEPPTPNYALNRPEPSDAMSNFDLWLNANWDKIADAASPPSGVTLPQVGSYNVGDRFYKSDTKSIYILVCKDVNWGWHWRPVQDAISPWFAPPVTCMSVGGWTLNPTPANPFAIAFDNRGSCHWRGIIGVTAGTIARASSISVFKPVPNGLSPRQRSTFMLGHETLAISTNGALTTSYQGARIFISDDAVAFPTVRCFGGTADFNRVHLGGVNYAVGSGKFFAV